LSREDELAGVVTRIEQILERGNDADDVLRDVLEALHAVYAYAALAFVEEGQLGAGPSSGTPVGFLRTVDVLFRGVKVAELRVVGGDDADDACLERVAALISPHCLVAWDTGGARWDSD
jgi:hypothetical protein